jgi:hypothetical protein
LIRADLICSAGFGFRPRVSIFFFFFMILLGRVFLPFPIFRVPGPAAPGKCLRDARVSIAYLNKYFSR